MKMLFITDLYPVTSKESTTPQTLHNFVKGWQSLGCKIDVIKPNFILNSFLRKKPFYKTGQYENVYNVNYFLPFWGNIIKKLPKLEKYDAIVSHMPSGTLFAYKIAKKMKKPLIIGIHSSDITVLTNPFYFLFKKRMEKAFDIAKGIFCRSDILKNKFLKLYPQFKNKTYVCPSGVDIEPILRKEDFNQADIRILTCANYKKRKNIEILCNALKKDEKITLTVIGEGYFSKRWRKYQPKIKFLGYQNQEKVISEMRNSDIFILPSVSETFGMVYLEAMAMGCITVGTKNDGIDGIIKDGSNGFLCQPTEDGIQKVIEIIKNLLQKDVLTIRKNAYNTVKEYSSKNCCNMYYEQILKII